jgi:uncharacterized membrane protein YjgN (DUF898 family)
MESKFTGGLLGLIGVNIITGLVTLLSLGLLTPQIICFRERWVARHTYIDGKRLGFFGNGMQLFGSYIKWFLLTIITFGIYSFWLNIKMKQWIISNTHFID